MSRLTEAELTLNPKLGKVLLTIFPQATLESGTLAHFHNQTTELHQAVCFEV